MTLTMPPRRTVIRDPHQRFPAQPADSPLLRASLFEQLDPELARTLAGRFDTFTAERGSLVFAEGDPAEYLYVVISGKVKLTRHAEDGRETVAALLGPSDQFGETSLLDSTPHTTAAVVVTDAHLARLPAAVLYEWIERYPAVAAQLLRFVARRLRRTHANLSDLVFVDTPGRVAAELLRLARRFGVRHGNEIRIEHDLNQSELAQLVGASRETVNKVLSNYSARGWIRTEPKCVTVLNRDGLLQRAR